MPREPEPANRSRTVTRLKSTPNRCSKTLNSACLDISEVGRVEGTKGAVMKRPPTTPFIIRQRLIFYVKVGRQCRKTIVHFPKLRDVLDTSDLLVFSLNGVVGVTPKNAKIAQLLKKTARILSSLQTKVGRNLGHFHKEKQKVAASKRSTLPVHTMRRCHISMPSCNYQRHILPESIYPIKSATFVL